MRKILSTILIGAVAFNVMGTSLVSASDNTIKAEVNQVASNVENITGNEEISTGASVTNEAYYYTESEIDITLPVRGDDLVTLDNGKDKISFLLPSEAADNEGRQTSNGTIVYYGDENAQISMQTYEAGYVRSLISIDNADASHSYSYEFDLDQGSKLVSSDKYDSIAESSGSVFIVDGNNDIIGLIGAPWAVDANGDEVETHFEIEENVLMQVVEFDENTAFPVIADPTVSNIVYKGGLTKNQCKKLYNRADQYTKYDKFVDMAEAIIIDLAKACDTKVGTAIALITALGKVFGKYNSMKSGFYQGKNNNGLSILLFSSGDMSYTVRK